MGLILKPVEVSSGMNMSSVLETAIDDDVCETRSINLIIEHILALDRTEHHQDLLMGFIPVLFQEWKQKNTKIDSFGAFLEDSKIPIASDEKRIIPNRFSWIIDQSKHKDLPKYTFLSGKLRVIKCDDPGWETLNPVIMEKNIEREAVELLIEMKKEEDLSDKMPDSEKKECQYYLYDTRQIEVKDILLKKLYQEPEWFLDVEWRKAHPYLKEYPRLKSCHERTKTYC